MDENNIDVVDNNKTDIVDENNTDVVDNNKTDIICRFTCDICNYTTGIKFCYDKHLETKKHIKNTKINIDKMINDKQIQLQKLVSNIEQHGLHSVDITHTYVCNYCGNKYTNAATLSRHKKACNEKDSLIKKYESEIDKYKQEIIYLKEDINRQTAEIKRMELYLKKLHLIDDEEKLI